jgi:hypothetical protein
MVIEGFRGSSGGGSIGGGGMGGGHESQLSFSGVGGRPSATGFQHQVQPSSNFDRYNSGNDRDRDRYRDHDRNNNNNIIHVGGGGRDGYDRNNWNGYYPPYTYYNPLMYQDRQPTEIVINEDKDNNKNSKNKMDETVKILLIVFICLFALVMLFMMLNFLKK